MKKFKKNNTFSFTTKELNVWIKEGLIPKDLLTLDKYPLLIKYVYTHQEVLFKCYRQNPVVNTLEKSIILEVNESILLEVRADEIKQWEKETAAIKELTKEQGKIFLKTLSEMSSKTNGTLSQKEIVTLIEEIRKTEEKEKKAGKYRKGGQYIDQKLKKESSFDPLLPATIEKIKSKNITVTAYGIKLTTAEDKLMNVISKLLHDKSENKDPKSGQYYAGNEESILIPYGDKSLRSVVLRLKPSELYKEYVGKDDYSGKEIENVKSVLMGLSEKKFLIQSDAYREVKTKNGIETVTDRTEGFQALINIDSFFDGMSAKEIKILDNGDKAFREQREELKIALHPILTDQISSKYIEYPSDINKRTEIASGGSKKVTVSIIDLRDYMMREKSAGRYKSELNESTLIEQLRLTAYAKQGRSKKVMQRIKEAIEANKKLGLILEHKKVTGKREQTKYVFTLNPDFE